MYGVRRLRDPVAILRANLSPDSAVLRHAVRLGVLVGASDLVARLIGVDRGYWIPLTVLVVLRPDFASTFQRSSMRVAGTIVGLILAIVGLVFIIWPGPTVTLLMILVGLSALIFGISAIVQALALRRALQGA